MTSHPRRRKDFQRPHGRFVPRLVPPPPPEQPHPVDPQLPPEGASQQRRLEVWPGRRGDGDVAMCVCLAKGPEQQQEAMQRSHDMVVEQLGARRAGPVQWFIFGRDQAEQELRRAGIELPLEQAAYLRQLPNSLAVVAAAPTDRYEHAEAFCLMTYRSDDDTEEEVVWNSRDGVTPFVITLRSGKQARHTDWRNDLRDPDFRPPAGMRIFVDATPVSARRRAEEFARRWWDDPEFPARTRYGSVEEMVEKLVAEWAQPGKPELIEVVPDRIPGRDA